MKLYKAVDKLDGKKSMFLVYDNGGGCCKLLGFSD